MEIGHEVRNLMVQGPRGRVTMAWLRIEDRICRSIADELTSPPPGLITGRPIANMSVLVSFLEPDKSVGPSGAVTCTNFQLGATLPDRVTKKFVIADRNGTPAAPGAIR